MKCQHCGAEVALKQEFCRQCGKKVVFEYHDMAGSILAEAAVRRGDRIEAWLTRVVMLMLIAGAVIYGLVDLYSKPLIYDGSLLPALPARDVPVANGGVHPAPYADPHPPSALPAPATRVFGYRKNPLHDRLREANTPGKADPRVQTAITNGLKFLAASQLTEGNWPVALLPLDWNQAQTAEFSWGEVAVTGLGLLAFLGEGETWLPDEATGQKGPYAEKIYRAVRWLMDKQDPATGRFGPLSTPTSATHFMYNQGIVTLALAEAAGLSGDPYVRDAAQKGLDFIVQAQTPDGGWTYWGLPSGDPDCSVSAWQAQALAAGQEAGLKVPDETLKKALEMYHQATLKNPHGEVRVAYTLKYDDRLNRPSLFGVALMIRQLLGDSRGPELNKLGLQLQSILPNVKPGWGHWRPGASSSEDLARESYDPYALYFATYGMFFLGGKDWEIWHAPMRQAVLEMQDGDGCWRTNDTYTKQGGFIYSTALSILTLQVYYRIH